MIISVMNWKGGQGKTTTTFQLSHILSERGYRVLAVDLDGQGNLTMALAGSTDLKAYLPDYFMFPDKEHSLLYILKENLHFIPNERTRSIEAVKIMGGRGRKGQEALKKLLNACKSEYDIILIDCPPSYDILTENALIASNRVLIPTELTKDSVEGMVSLIREIKDISEVWDKPDLNITGVFKFRPKENTIYQRNVLAFLEKLVGNKLMKTAVRENIRVPESQAKEMPITVYDPKSNGAMDFTSLADEVIFIENLRKVMSYGEETK